MTEKLEIIIVGKDQFSNAFSKLRSALPSVKSLAIGAGTAVAGLGTALFAMSKSTAEAYDKVQKLSDQLGATTEFLSSMQYAADLSGIQTDTFNRSIQTLQVRIGEAGRGLGQARDAFEALGVSLRDSGGQLKTAEQILPEVADGFYRMSNATERAESASKLFGQRGISMVQMLKDGSGKLREMREEAEKFGLVVSGDAGTQAAEFNDSITRMAGSFKGVKDTISKETLPIITELSDRLAEFVAQNRDKIVATLKDFGIATYNYFKRIALGMAGLMDSVKPLLAKAIEHVNRLWDTFNELPTWAKEVGVIGAFVLGKRGAVVLVGLIDLIDRLKKANQAYSQAIEEQGDRDWGKILWDPEGAKRARELMDNHNLIVRKKIEQLNDDIPPISPKFDDDSIKSLIEGYFSIFEGMLSEIGGPEDGAPPFSNRNVEKAVENMALMKDNFSQYFEDMIWSRQELSDHDRALTGAEADADADKKAKTLAATSKLMADMYSVSVTYGKKQFKFQKGIAVAQATMKAIEAFNVNTAQYAYPWGAIIGGLAKAVALANVAAIASQEPPAAHGGLDYVPKEQTYLLDRGERVLSPNQNRELIEFMRSEGNSAPIIVEKIEIIAPESAPALTRTEWDVIVEENIIPAFQRLANRGIRA
jgi:hypothetical protein